MRGCALLLACLACPASASAHPGFVDIRNHAFDPQIQNVTEGSLVEWRWDGPDLNHTISSDDFESDPGKSPAQVLHSRGDSFAFLFERAGTYAYHCRVHPNMTGKVVVEPPAVRDERAPRISAVTARIDRREAVVRFRIDERASVLAEVRRPGASKVLADSFRFVRPGVSSVRVDVPRGASVVRLVATDDVGNPSRPRSVSVRR